MKRDAPASGDSEHGLHLNALNHSLEQTISADIDGAYEGGSS